MSVAPEPVNPEHDPMTIDPSNLGSVDPLSVEGIFLVALGKQGDDRATFLNVQCGDDERRQRVEALLSAYENAGSFLEKPAIASEPTPVGQFLAPCEVPGSIGKLGPYEILEEIGRGGMGVVFRAHDPQLQRIVAVKALAPELARLPSARQRFLREARAAAAISHPHVVTIFAVDGTEEASLGTERATLPYLVMECIVGQTLHDKIKRVGALKTEEIVRISRQIAEGLTAAHKRGLIHRDIKPANILLENGVERVKITDFGLARTVSDGGITHTGEILGTPQCMSPEQARGELVDQRSDLFSLGCVMYTMCTGVSPFRADNMLAVMKKVCEAEPRPIAQLNPNIPEWLSQLVHQLLEKQPERRVQTADGVVQVLEGQVITSRPVVSPTTSTAPDQSARDVPKWLLTPIIPGLEQWLFKDSLLPVTLLAMLIGFFFGEDRESRIQWLPVAGFLGFGLWALVKVWLKAPWNWINWKSMISVPLGMFLGGVSRAWLIHKSRSGVGLLEEMARNNAGWFVFPLAIAIFWFLNRYFRGLFIQNPRSVSEALSPPPRPTHWSTWAILGMTVIVVGMLAFSPSRHAPSPNLMEPVLLVYVVALNIWIFVHLVAWGVRLAGSKERTFNTDVQSANVSVPPNAAVQPPRSPWSVLGWILVTILGVGMLGAVLLAVGLLVPYFAARNAPMPSATYVLRIPGAENVKYVTINGEQAILQPGGPGEWRIATTPGTHSIYVSYSSDSTLNQERFFTTSATVQQGRTTVVAAEPVMVRSLTRPPGLQMPTPLPTDQPAASPLPSMGMSSADSSSSMGGGMGMGSSYPAVSFPTSIPLADAVEVLTDPSKMPKVWGAFSDWAGPEPQVLLWIDEPGLQISLKPVDFDGGENTGEVYVSRNAWGVGGFYDSKEGTLVHVLPGRYRVLVQDLDYGWEVDRRGTLVIGNGQHMIHVKRSFAGQQLRPKEYPAPFRWAGKSYQLSDASQALTVAGFLATLAGGVATPMLGLDHDAAFDGHPLAEQIVMGTPQGERTLKYNPNRVKVDIQSPNMRVVFEHPHGSLIWDHSVPEGFSVPVKDSTLTILRDGFLWWSKDTKVPFDPNAYSAEPLVIRQSRLLDKEAAARGFEEWQPGTIAFNWYGFEEAQRTPTKSGPAIRRLVTAWADGQPDVPEAELLQLGGAASLEELWKLPTPVPSPAPANYVPAATSNEKEEPKPEEPKPEFAPPAFLVPGSTPGTWRMKEPPEGAVTKE